MSPTDRRSGPTLYRRAQLEARQLAGVLEEDAARNIQRALNEYADDLAEQLQGLTGDRARAVALSESVLRRTQERLRQAMVQSVDEARRLSYQGVQEIWREAALQVADARGTANALMGAVRVPPLSLLGAYEGLGSSARTWKTLAAEYAGAASADVDGVVRQALLRGTSPDKLARRLRPYVAGADTVKDLVRGLDGVSLSNLRGASGRALGAAGRMRFNARRIAFTELHNARAEAEVLHFAADPHVKAVGWRLSPSRGSVVAPDECDALATQDFYGLGPGVYPVHAVPFPPHPFDRCERVPITRGLDDVGTPKPRPTIRKDVSQISIPNGHRITKQKGSEIRSNLRQLFRDTERLGPQEALQELSARASLDEISFAPTTDTIELARQVAKRSRVDGMTNAAIADELGVSSSRVGELLKIETQFRHGIPRDQITGRLTLDELDELVRGADTPGPTLETIEQAQKARQLKLDGMTNAAIADELGVSSSRVSELRKIGRQWEAGVPKQHLTGRINNDEVEDLIRKHGFGGKTPPPAKPKKPTTKKPKTKAQPDDVAPPSSPDLDDVNWEEAELFKANVKLDEDEVERLQKLGRQAFEDAPEDLQRAYLNADQIRKVDISPAALERTSAPSAVSWYDPSDVSVGFTSVNRWTWQHEFGHHLDRVLGKRVGFSPLKNGGFRSQGGGFAKAFSKTARRMETDGDYHDKVATLWRQVREQGTFDDQRMFDDLAGSISWNNSPTGRVGTGHGASYYQASGTLDRAETFANLNVFYAQSRTGRQFAVGPWEDMTVWEAIEDVFPELADEYKSLIQSLN